MANFLHQYYGGITRQLRSEVDFINSLFEHQGVKGEGNELALRELLTKFIPKRFGIGTGVVVDREGNISRQCDIIIYDTQLYPSLLSMSSVHMFPVDLVYATIEIKTTLTAQTSKDALQNIASVRRLKYIEAEFADFHTTQGGGAISIVKTTPPIGIVFAYNSEAKNDTTIKKWFTPTKPSEAHLYPSLACSLDFGMAGFSAVFEDGSLSGFADQPSDDLRPVFSILPLARAREGLIGEIKSIADVQYVKFPQPIKEKFVVDESGNSYPVKTLGTDIVPIDQTRVLMNFLLLFSDMLALKKIHPAISFLGTYATPLDMFHFHV